MSHFGFLIKNYSETKAKLTAANVELAVDRPENKQMIANFPDKVRVEPLTVPVAFHHIHITTTDQESLRT